MPQPVIQVENLSKQYRLGEVGTGTLSHDLKRWWYRARGREDPYARIGELNDRSTRGSSEYVWALKDINFSVQPGEVLGIIGRNGAGKSTLLKLLSKTTAPTTGNIKVRGRIASLLEVGTGFHPELTGRENIYLNGAILGMTRREITRQFDAIVDFAGVERYVDTPVKRYSSGMYVRLAFAVAAHLEPEILIVDEVLAVGDAEFQKKCLGKMKDVSVNEGRTVLFVSHNMQAITSLTDKCFFLKNGSLVKEGLTYDVIDYYMNSEIDKSLVYQSVEVFNQPKILRVKLNTSFDNNVQIHGEHLEIEIDIFLPHPLKNGALSLQIFNSLEIPLVHVWLFNSEQESFKKKGINKLKFLIPKLRLFLGKYSFTLNLAEHGGYQLIEKIEKICPFEVVMYNTIHDHPWQEGTCTYLEEYSCFVD